jgi:PhnB protein
MAFYPYLFFGGDCREAFTRYQEVFGGELSIMTFSDNPDEGAPPGLAELVMHASLLLDGESLMGSDDPDVDFGPVNGMMIGHSSTEAAEAERIFAALAEGGTELMPMEETFWAPRFGMCVDRFGTPWMISADAPESEDR